MALYLPTELPDGSDLTKNEPGIWFSNSYLDFVGICHLFGLPRIPDCIDECLGGCLADDCPGDGLDSCYDDCLHYSVVRRVVESVGCLDRLHAGPPYILDHVGSLRIHDLPDPLIHRRFDFRRAPGSLDSCSDYPDPL